MAGEQWYYVQSGQRVGPVSIETLRGMIAGNAVSVADLVWSEGMPDWVAAAAIPALQNGVSPVTPLPPSYAPPAYTAHGTYPQQGFTPPHGYAPPGYAPVGSNLGYYSNLNAGPVYAGFWLRFVASVLDTILLTVIAFVVSYGIGMAIGASMASSGRSLRDMQLVAVGVAQIASLLIQWVYYAGMESSANQATLGKMALGLRVTDYNLARVGFGKATGRFIGRLVELSPALLGNFLTVTRQADANSAMLLTSVGGLAILVTFGMAGWTQKKQAGHDMMSGCLVIKK